MNPEPDPVQAVPPTAQEAQQRPENKSIKKYFLYITIIGLVLSAVISVVAVLIGEFNEFIGRSLSTTFISVIYSLLFLSLISKNDKAPRKSDTFIINTVLGLAVVGFISSILGIWEIIEGIVVYRIYVVLFYTLILCILSKALLSVNLTNNVVRAFSYTSLGFSFVLYLLLVPTVMQDGTFALPEEYYRFISAAAILVGTSSVLTAIFDKLNKKH